MAINIPDNAYSTAYLSEYSRNNPELRGNMWIFWAQILTAAAAATSTSLIRSCHRSFNHRSPIELIDTYSIGS